MSTSTPSLPPGPRAPRALQTLAWITRPGPFMERCRARYGDMFTLKIANEGTWVFVTDPDAVKQIFTGDPRLLHAGEANVVLKPLLGENSVLLLDEDRHMRERKLMLPPFHGERMQSYGELMRAITAEELARWPVGEPFALHPRMQDVTLEVIIRAVLGVTEGTALDEFRTVLREPLDFLAHPSRLAVLAIAGPNRVGNLGPFRRMRDRVDRALLAEIARRREDPGLEERADILSLLVQARREDDSALTDAELRDELMTLLVAGHETTATALAWAVERLLRNPDALARLRDEVAAGEDEYLDAVIKETLRLRPVLPIVLRRLVEPLEIGGRLLPADARVAPCIYLVHRDPDVYPEPARFRPERFLEQKAGTYTWFPFGGGVRRCLGASFAIFEMKAVLSAIVSELELEASDPRPERVTRRAITFTPSRGAGVIVRERRAAMRAQPDVEWAAA